MKRLFCVLIIAALVCTCGGVSAFAENDETDLPALYNPEWEENITELDDPALLQYVEDSVYEYLDAQYSNGAYSIDEVSAIYISREYLEETAYNSKANIFFGYTLSDLDAAFGDTKYVFTCNNEGETVVEAFREIPDDTYERVIRNVTIGTGVILVCVVVSVATGGAGTAAAVATASTKVSMIFAASAKTAAQFAVSGAVFSTATSAIVRGIESGDVYETFSSAAVAGSESFKWGAISGAVVGGATKAYQIHRASTSIPTPRQAEENALSKFPGDKQKSYMNGQEVPYATAGSTRPDIVGSNGVAYEVKCYDLTSKSSLYELRSTLTKEIGDRVVHLPDGMEQAIILDVEGRGYTQTYVQSVVDWIQDFMEPIYPDIGVEVLGATL